MILGYKQPPGEDDYHFGKIAGTDKKFRRVIAGIIMPVFDRQAGAVVILGELYRSFAPQAFTGLAAFVGSPKELEQFLIEQDKKLQFHDAVLESEEMRRMLWRVDGLSLMIITWAAPSYAFTEVGRSRVDQLISEDRLHLDLITTAMSVDPEMSAKALQAIVCYAQDSKPIYRKPAGPLKYDKVWGMEGL